MFQGSYAYKELTLTKIAAAVPNIHIIKWGSKSLCPAFLDDWFSTVCHLVDSNLLISFLCWIWTKTQATNGPFSQNKHNLIMTRYLVIAEGSYLLLSVRLKVTASYCFWKYQLILITDHMRQPENLPRLKSPNGNIFSPLTLHLRDSLPSSLVRQSRIPLSQYPWN